MNRRPKLDFWYDFASPYSSITARRIDTIAEEAGVHIVWRPFVVASILPMPARGLPGEPAAKQRYMWRDLEREAARAGLVCRPPDPFPQSSLAAARIALIGLASGWTSAFSAVLFHAAYEDRRSIADQGTLADVLKGLDLDAGAILKEAQGEANRARLKVVTEEAKSKGIFADPTFVTEDGEMFCGNDRVDQALAWANGERPRGLR